MTSTGLRLYLALTYVTFGKVENVVSNLYFPYADDAKLFKHIQTPDDRSSLQNMFNNVQLWIDKWQLSLKFGKCVTVFNSRYHRLCGSESPVLTATHHYCGSPRLSVPAHLWSSDPPTNLQAKWLKRCGFTQECAFCSKIPYISHPLISRPPKRSKFCNFFCKCLDLKFFRSILTFNNRCPQREHQLLFFIGAQ